MALTIGRPVGQAGGEFEHARSGVKVRIRSSERRMTHSVGSVEYEVPYYVGSGRVGRSYLVRIGPALFQSPASWFASGSKWGMSPGYESDPVPEFDRAVTPECLFCHSSGVRHIQDSINRYADPPFAAGGIGCDRCHGDPVEHIRRPSRANIINPVRLTVRARNSVCEACHLSGEARIANPGSKLWDFRPGMDLEQVLGVYVTQQRDFRVVSHVEQLADSRCAKESGSRLWCGTCHDPHAEPADPITWYRAKCVGCHVAAHYQLSGDCVSCHMTKRPARDVAHTAFTDHRIVRRQSGEPPPAGVPAVLSAWQPMPAPFRNRNLGLAYVAAGEKHSSAALLQEGFRLLTAEPLEDDAPALTGIGHVLLRKQRPREAARLFLRAAELEPANPLHYINAAAALSAVPEHQAAVAAAEKAIALEPLLKDAYVLAAEIYRKLGDRSQAARMMRRYDHLMRARP